MVTDEEIGVRFCGKDSHERGLLLVKVGSSRLRIE